MATMLFVDGLPVSYSANELLDLFSPIGTVLSTRVVRDLFHTSLGFGYVEMNDVAAAERAMLTLNGLSVNGRCLRVVPALVRPLPQAS